MNTPKYDPQATKFHSRAVPKPGEQPDTTRFQTIRPRLHRLPPMGEIDVVPEPAPKGVCQLRRDSEMLAER